MFLHISAIPWKTAQCTKNQLKLVPIMHMRDQYCQNQMVISDYFYELLMTFQMCMARRELNINIIFNQTSSEPQKATFVWLSCTSFKESSVTLVKQLLESATRSQEVY